MGKETFFVGIDFGSFKTSIAASNGRRDSIRTAVGWPRDHVARALLGCDFVFGEQLAEAEMAVDIVRPFAKGGLKYLSQSDAGISDEQLDRYRESAHLVLQHALSRVDPPADAQVFAVIGAPSRASIVNKRVITEAARGIFDGIAIVAEPFAVAYAMKRLMKTIVVDIGAGTIDICPLYGVYPSEDDQVTIPVGGDAIDEEFLGRMRDLHPEAQLTLDMAREIKERHGFVHDVNETAVVVLPVEGVPTNFDVTDILKESCKSIVDKIVDGVKQVTIRVNPRFQSDMLHNIILGGGGSQLKGLDTLIEQGLVALGGGKVCKVPDSVFAGAVGALRMAMSMPSSSWERISNPDSAAAEELADAVA